MTNFLNHIDLRGNQIRNAVGDRRANNPSSPVEGQFWYNDTLNQFFYFDGAQIVAFGGSGVQAVQATLPLESTGGSSPTLTIRAASASERGTMSSAHFSLLADATALATNNAIARRNSSGELAASLFIGNLSGTASNASQLNSQPASFYRDRTNHTGTQSASTISDFDTAVRANRLDQLAAPTSNVSLNSQRIVSLATPQNPGDAATKQYVDSISAGLIDSKESVRVATTTAITLATPPSSIDNVVMVTGDRVLVKNQNNPTENGIYTWATGGMVRATDADTSAEVTSGMYCWVEDGTQHGGSGWRLSTLNPITLGTSAIEFTQFSGLGEISAGVGLTKTGNVLNVGTGLGIAGGADSITIDTGVVVRKAAFTVGDGTATSFTLTHGFGSRDFTCRIYELSGSYVDVLADVSAPTVDTVRVEFSAPPTANSLRVVIHA